MQFYGISCIHLSSLVDVKMCFIFSGRSKHVEDTIIKLNHKLKKCALCWFYYIVIQISKNRSTIIYMIIQSTLPQPFKTSMNIHQPTYQKFPSSQNLGVFILTLRRRFWGMFTLISLESIRFIAFMKYFICALPNSRIRGVAFLRVTFFSLGGLQLLVCSKPHSISVLTK
jgi:hypothetical protein